MRDVSSWVGLLVAGALSLRNVSGVRVRLDDVDSVILVAWSGWSGGLSVPFRLSHMGARGGVPLSGVGSASSIVGILSGSSVACWTVLLGAGDMKGPHMANVLRPGRADSGDPHELFQQGFLPLGTGVSKR